MLIVSLEHLKLITCTAHWAAMTPSTGDSAKGSKLRSARLMKSGLSKYPQLPLYSNFPWFNCIGKSDVWKLRETIWQPAFQNTCDRQQKTASSPKQEPRIVNSLLINEWQFLERRFTVALSSISIILRSNTASKDGDCVRWELFGHLLRWVSWINKV